MIPEEVIPGIKRLTSESEPPLGWQKPFFYLLGSENLLLIDTGYREPEILQKIHHILSHSSAELKTLILTHGHIDHAGACKEIKENFHPQIIAHRSEKEILKRRNLDSLIDQWIDGGSQIQTELGEIEIINTPGHSPGHICLYLKKEEILFTGDLIVGDGTSFVGPPDGNMIDYMNSLRVIANLKVRLMLPGHGPVIKKPEKYLKELIEHRELREYQILKMLSENPMTASELARKIYTGLIHPGLRQAAEITVLGHLSKLEKENKVACELKGDQRIFRLL